MADKIGKKVLIIDDEPDVVTYLQTFFEDNGFDTITAENGKQGMAKMKSEKPDIVTLDISMPEETGVKFFRKAQEDDEINKIPVIIITGVTMEFKKFISTRKQVDPPLAYFEKPIDREKLLAKVKEILNID